MNGPELLNEGVYTNVCAVAKKAVLICVCVAVARVPSMTSVIPPLDRAPVNSRLHNVRQAVNTLDRVR